MPICKLIFRLDFNFNFNFIKNQGSIFEILKNGLTGKTIKNIDFGENINNRLMFARYLSDDKHFFKQLNVQPTNIDGIFENTKGIEMSKLIFDEDGFLSLTKTVTNFCRELKIDKILRSGFRILYFNKLCDSSKEINDAFFRLFRNESISKINKCLGKIEDYGILFNGISVENIKYHLRTGPFTQNEFPNYLNYTEFELKENEKYDFMIDLDLYEENFLLSKRDISKLYLPIIDKAEQIIKAVEEIIEINLEG